MQTVKIHNMPEINLIPKALNPIPNEFGEFNLHASLGSKGKFDPESLKLAAHDDVVVNAACWVMRVTREDFFSKSRKNEILFARMMAYVYFSSNTRYSGSKIATICGGKNHATVINSRRRHASLIQTGDKGLMKIEHDFVAQIKRADKNASTKMELYL